MTVTILGTGYVGLTTATLLAHVGYRVYAVDPNSKRLSAIKKGLPFFYEQGLDGLVASAVKAGKLQPTASYKDSVSQSEIVFSCVGTPDNPDGSSNLSYIFAAAKEAVKYLRPGTIFVQKSTVPVGTGSRVEQIFKRTKKPIAYISNPEFLREGTALSDSLFFDRIVVGGNDLTTIEKVIELYQSIEQHRPEIAAMAKIPLFESNQGLYIRTSLNSAELIKVTANAYLALKISFANSIAKLADETGANVSEVMDAVGADKRIGRAFLNAGRGYGGGCFPKDVSGLISSASDHGVDLTIMTAAAELNETMPGYIAAKAQKVLGNLSGKSVAVLGLAFKAGTSDARRSPGVKLANIMAKNGARVRAYDPEANNEAETELRKGIDVCKSIETTVKDAAAVFIATDWPHFLEYDLKKLAGLMSGQLFVDAMNVFDKAEVNSAGFTYLGVGR